MRRSRALALVARAHARHEPEATIWNAQSGAPQASWESLLIKRDLALVGTLEVDVPVFERGERERATVAAEVARARQ